MKENAMPRPGVCCVIGAGDATGSAVARRFAKEGYTVCVARRTATALKPLVDQIIVEGGRAVAFGLDARREDQVVNFFQHIEAEVGPVEVLVFNVGGNVRFPVLETTAQKYFKVWEMCAMAGFLAGREAARLMLPRGRGTLLFTGATASLRGAAGFSAFAGGKAGAYLANSHVSPRYTGNGRTITAKVTTVGAAGDAGRTRVLVVYARMEAAKATDAVKA
jgi:NAD(P)-dependent dehydrogenase (short-subunit alcohol dehydrogenase family)